LFWVVAAVEQDDKLLHSGNEAITPSSKITAQAHKKNRLLVGVGRNNGGQNVALNSKEHENMKYCTFETSGHLICKWVFGLLGVLSFEFNRKIKQMVSGQRAKSLCPWKIMTDSQTSFDY
jgi:hypothetical protein